MKFKNVAPFLIIASLTYFLSGADVFETFIPRKECMLNNSKLISLHLIANGAASILFTTLGILIFKLWQEVKSQWPFASYLWKVAGIFFFVGIIFFIAACNLYVSYYWIDGAMRLILIWFVLMFVISLVKDFNRIKSAKGAKYINELKLSIDTLLENLKIKYKW